MKISGWFIVVSSPARLVCVLALAVVLGACAHTSQPLSENTESVTAVASSSAPEFVALDWQRYDGRKKYVRNGHCVMLILDAVPALGNTRNWVRGDHIYNNPALVPGTPIATFDESGTYGNHRRGRSHAALYVGQTEAGIYVIDQWRPTRKSRGQKPRQRFIPWNGGEGAKPANSAMSYFVINRQDRDARVLANEE